MFNTAQSDVIRSLVPTMANKGYKNYIAYTYTYNDSFYKYDPDLIFIFSSDKITATGNYTYSIPKNSIRVKCRTRNGSDSSLDSRIITENFNQSSIKIDYFEHISTNAEFTGISIQPDLCQEGSGNFEKSEDFLLLLSFTTAIILFYIAISSVFFRKR